MNFFQLLLINYLLGNLSGRYADTKLGSIWINYFAGFLIRTMIQIWFKLIQMSVLMKNQANQATV